jgi:hypothetical protein
MFKRLIQRLFHFLRALVYDDVAWTKDGYGEAGVRLGAKAAAKIRGLIVLAGLGVGGGADEIMSYGVLPPTWGKYVKFGGFILAGLGTMIHAGDKNPPAPVAPPEG